MAVWINKLGRSGTQYDLQTDTSVHRSPGLSVKPNGPHSAA